MNMEPLEHPSDMVPGCAKVEYLYHVAGSRPCLHYFCKQVGDPPMMLILLTIYCTIGVGEIFMIRAPIWPTQLVQLLSLSRS